VKTFRVIVLLGTGCLFMSCATATLTPEGERVRVVSTREEVQGCQLIGVVETQEEVSAGEMIYILRNKAAAMQADTLLLPRGAGFWGGAFAVKSGNAYRCAEAQRSPIQPR